MGTKGDEQSKQLDVSWEFALACSVDTQSQAPPWQHYEKQKQRNVQATCNMHAKELHETSCTVSYKKETTWETWT